MMSRRLEAKRKAKLKARGRFDGELKQLFFIMLP
jgi:hypothetical protein